MDVTFSDPLLDADLLFIDRIPVPYQRPLSPCWLWCQQKQRTVRQYWACLFSISLHIHYRYLYTIPLLSPIPMRRLFSWVRSFVWFHFDLCQRWGKRSAWGLNVKYNVNCETPSNTPTSRQTLGLTIHREVQTGRHCHKQLVISGIAAELSFRETR